MIEKQRRHEMKCARLISTSVQMKVIIKATKKSQFVTAMCSKESSPSMSQVAVIAIEMILRLLNVID